MMQRPMPGTEGAPGRELDHPPRGLTAPVVGGLTASAGADASTAADFDENASCGGGNRTHRLR